MDELDESDRLDVSDVSDDLDVFDESTEDIYYSKDPYFSRYGKTAPLRTPEDRGLCKECAKFNWHFFFTRHEKDTRDGGPEDFVSIWERNTIDQVCRSSEYTAEHKSFDLPSQYTMRGTSSSSHPKQVTVVSGLPYSGEYLISKKNPRTIYFEIGAVDIERTRQICTLCDLFWRAYQDVLTLHTTRGHVFEPELYPITCIATTHSKRSVLSFGKHNGEPIAQFDLGPSTLGKIDPKISQAWLSECEANHGERCRSVLHTGEVPNNSKVLPFTIKVIDVITNCIVSAPINSRYLALSYVWGFPNTNQTTFDLVTKTLDITKNPEAQTSIDRNLLPRTIEHAMTWTELLGERFLWVDALCIDQADGAEKAVMILAMDKIYRGAALTIIAADGVNSGAGLPGLPSSSRQPARGSGSIDGINLIHAMSILNTGHLQIQTTPMLYGQALLRSPWATRGWTYQEYHCSARCLVFLDEYVHFECYKGVRSEFDPKQVATLSSGKHREEKPSPNSSSSNSAAAKIFGKYNDYVKEYTRRRLTYGSDILNAFTAILANYTLEHGIKFCWGIPMLQGSFHGFLWAGKLWASPDKIPGSIAEMASNLNLLDRRLDLATNGREFPSWAWSGWVGQVFHVHSTTTQYVHSGKLYRSESEHSLIIWPWDQDYSLILDEDPAASGILIIDACIYHLDLAAMILYQGSCSADVHAVLKIIEDEYPDSTSMRACLHLGYSRMDCKTEPTATSGEIRLNFLMIVELESDGLYYRRGLLKASQCFLDDAATDTKIILLA